MFWCINHLWYWSELFHPPRLANCGFGFEREKVHYPRMYARRKKFCQIGSSFPKIKFLFKIQKLSSRIEQNIWHQYLLFQNSLRDFCLHRQISTLPVSNQVQYLATSDTFWYFDTFVLKIINFIRIINTDISGILRLLGHISDQDQECWFLMASFTSSIKMTLNDDDVDGVVNNPRWALIKAAISPIWSMINNNPNQCTISPHHWCLLLLVVVCHYHRCNDRYYTFS